GVLVVVGLHGGPATAGQGLLAALRQPPEALVELGGAAIGGVRDLARDPEPDVGAVVGGRAVVVAAPEPRVGPDGRELAVGPRDLSPDVCAVVAIAARRRTRSG